MMQKNVLEYLERSAARLPDKVAFADETEEFSFGRLLRAARGLGSLIASETDAVNRPVIVLVDRRACCLAAFMGVLQSGNYYVPLDNSMPEARLDSIVEQLSPAALIFDGADRGLAERYAGYCPIIDMREGFEYPAAEQELDRRRKMVLDIDPVYVIFTSGSTGAPKGIVISHRSVIDFTDWMAEACGVTEADVMGNQAPFYFDLSVKDIYQTLRAGATTHVLPKKLFMFPALLVQELDRLQVTALIWATSAFTLVANSGALKKLAPSSVDKVILGGEAMHAKHLNIWRAALPDTKYINLYGPTEVTVDCTYYVIDREYADGEVIPIGRACENKQVMLLDDELRPVADGEPGEICVRGTGLAHGYYGDREKTEGAFVQNPANPWYRDIIYRTGDMGYVNEEGLIVFLSRRDGQIKHMGYRIELGEIETAVTALEGISAAACFFDSERDRIVCCYEGALERRELINGVKERLPKYMLPNVCLRLESMPMNANGKIDRVRLKAEYDNGKNN